MKISEMFDKAADLLETRGWNQGAYYATDGSHCLVGALQESSGAYRYRREQMLNFNKAHDLLLIYLNQNSVENWNDTHGRTQEEVIGALRGVAMLQRKVENSVPLPVVTPVVVNEPELEPA